MMDILRPQTHFPSLIRFNETSQTFKQRQISEARNGIAAVEGFLSIDKWTGYPCVIADEPPSSFYDASSGQKAKACGLLATSKRSCLPFFTFHELWHPVERSGLISLWRHDKFLGDTIRCWAISRSKKSRLLVKILREEFTETAGALRRRGWKSGTILRVLF